MYVRAYVGNTLLREFDTDLIWHRAYPDILMSSPVFHRCMAGKFSIPWEIFVLVFAWNITFSAEKIFKIWWGFNFTREFSIKNKN